jgi:CTP:molybdopterin cytidylyltransferase MocA
MKIFSSIILSAGYSSRMSVLKPLLPVGGQSAVVRAVTIMRDAGVTRVTVVAGYRFDEVDREVRAHFDDVAVVNNADFDSGMFSSVQAGVRALPRDTDGFFLLPVDCCAVSPGTVTVLTREFDGEHILYPTYGGTRGHPPLIPYRHAAGLLTYNGDGGARGYLTAQPSHDVETDDSGVLLDMDTPSDYARLLRSLSLTGCPTREECAEILARYNVPEDIVRHGQDVAALADRIADGLDGKLPLSRELLYAMCALHDICRAERDHAPAGARLLLSLGYPELYSPVAEHMDASDPLGDTLTEGDILYLADKLSRRGETLAPGETLRRLREKYGEDSDAYRAALPRMERAEKLLRILRERYGLKALI